MAMQQYTAEEEYPELENNHSHMAHCLTEKVYKHMRAIETTSGFTIDNVIQTGVDNPGNHYCMTMGCLAGDEESYRVFAEFFDQVIEARHNGYKAMDQHPINTDYSTLTGGENLDKDIVLSCKVRSVRNLKGFCLPSHCTRAERRQVEKIIKNAFEKMTDDFKGKYHPLKGLSDEQQKNVLGSTKSISLLSATQLHSCMVRDWPDARGLWLNEKKNFIVKVNEEDHLRIITTQERGDITQAFITMRKGIEQLNNCIQAQGHQFMYDSHLGYIATCPGNLGTGIEVSVQMKIPKLSKQFRFDEVLRRLRLEKRQAHQEDSCTSANRGIFDILNADRLGVSEVEIIQTFIDGIEFLINCEKKMQKGESIERDINLIKLK